MKNIHPADLIAILTRIAGLSALVGDAAFAQSLNALLGPAASTVITVLSLISIVATDIIRVVNVPTQGAK